MFCSPSLHQFFSEEITVGGKPLSESFFIDTGQNVTVAQTPEPEMDHHCAHQRHNRDILTSSGFLQDFRKVPCVDDGEAIGSHVLRNLGEVRPFC